MYKCNPTEFYKRNYLQSAQIKEPILLFSTKLLNYPLLHLHAFLAGADMVKFDMSVVFITDSLQGSVAQSSHTLRKLYIRQVTSV